METFSQVERSPRPFSHDIWVSYFFRREEKRPTDYERLPLLSSADKKWVWGTRSQKGGSAALLLGLAHHSEVDPLPTRTS